MLYYLRCACFLELVSAARSKRIPVHQVQEDEDDTVELLELESSSSL